MKRIICLFFCFIFFFGITAKAESKAVYSTDIIVNLNGLYTECYSIDNKVYVVAEEFLNHGFYGYFGEATAVKGAGRELSLMQDFTYIPSYTHDNTSFRRKTIEFLGYTSETDIALHIYGNEIPTYHFDGKLLVAPEDMFAEAQRIRLTREIKDVPNNILLSFFITAIWNEQTRILDVYTEKDKFFEVDIMPHIQPYTIEGFTVLEKL